MRRALAVAAMIAASPDVVRASTPESFAALDRASASACLRAAGLVEGSVGAAARFSDDMRVDARVVTGVGPGGRATMLCLYDRRAGRAEVQEFTASAAAPTPAAGAIARDVFWRAVEIDGRAPVGRTPVTVYFGSDGRVAGRSGCNNYSARYRLSGSDLTVYPPLIGTRMACAPAVMRQEERFRDILSRARTVQPGPRGNMILATEDGVAIMLARR